MADSKITDLTQATSIASTDLLPIVTGIGSSPTTKSISGSALFASGYAMVAPTFGVNVVIGSGLATITSGSKAMIEMPFSGTITRVDLLANETGSITVDIWKDTYANYPPTVADSICASDKVAISSTNKASKTSFTGWTLTFSAGDILVVNVDSATTVKQVTLSIKGTKSL